MMYFRYKMCMFWKETTLVGSWALSPADQVISQPNLWYTYAEFYAYIISAKDFLISAQTSDSIYYTYFIQNRIDLYYFII